jgi:hypothetical protein
MASSKIFRYLLVLNLVAGLCLGKSVAQGSDGPQGQGRSPSTVKHALPALHPLDDEYLEWPLAPADKAYGAIDGRHLKQYVAEIVAISERYRDQGHQFWGRITGTSSDVETQQWVLNKFKQAGLSDIRSQPFDLPPQWIPQSWEITAVGNGKTLHFPSAEPPLHSPGTSKDGLDLEAVWIGTGNEADYHGMDVHGKAVFIYSTSYNHSNFSAATEGTALLAEKKGAAAIFIIFAVPGNVGANLYHLYPRGAHVPTFSIGLTDGLAMRDLIGESSAGQPPHVKVRMDVELVPNLKTAIIWGTLPGKTDEKIYVIAHRDAVFDGAVDNASGMAAMIGLAEYFAKIPKEQRRRTIVFVATTGHHNYCSDQQVSCSIGVQWMVNHREELFKNTALIINSEHVATTQTSLYDPQVRPTTATGEADFWYTNGSSRLTQIAFNSYREFGLPIYTQADSSAPGEGGPLSRFSDVPMLQLVNLGLYSHTDQETLDDMPWTALEAATRSFAKIINDVNTLEIRDLLPTTTAEVAPR